MTRSLTTLLVVLTLVSLLVACGPFAVALPGGATPTATTTPTATIQVIVVTATPTATSTPAATVPSATATAAPIIPPTITAAPPTATRTATLAAPTNTSVPAPPTNTPVPPAPTATRTLPPPAIARPDLFISELTLDPAIPRMGQLVSIRVGVYNQGNATASAFHVEWWAASATKGCDWDVANLVASGGRILTCTYTYPGWSNSYAVRAVADSTNAVTESDETDNTKTINVQVLPAPIIKPNLIISDLHVTPASPKSGVQMTFSATVYNDGNAPSPASVVTIYSAASTVACTRAVVALPANGGIVINCTYTYGGWSNAYVVRAVADSAGDVSESDETDNSRQITIAVQP